MKVLVTATIGRTVDAFLREQITELQRRGHTVHVMCAEPGPIDDLDRAGLVVGAPWTRPLRPWALPSAVIRTRSILRQLEPDLVYTHTAIAYCAHGFNGADAQPRATRYASRAAERSLRRITDLLLVMNDEDEAWAARARFANVMRIASIGLPLDRYRAPARAIPRDHELVVVAEPIPRKRVHLALEALGRLDDRFRLTLVGDGPLRPELESLAVRLGVAERTTFVGQVADVRPYLRRAWAVVSTSRQEGLARSLLEAMACGTPTVGFEARGVTDLLRDGAGILVGGDDPAALAAALTRLADRPDDWSTLRDAGLGVARMHGVDRIAVDVVDRLVSLARD